MKQTREPKRRKGSLRILLFLCVILVGVLPMAAVSVLTVSSSYNNHVNSKLNELQYYAASLISEMEEKNYMSNLSQPVVTAELEQMAPIYRGRVILVDSNYRICKDTFVMGEGKYNISESVIRCFNGTSASRFDPEGAYLEVVLPIKGDEGNVEGVMAITASTEFLDDLKTKLEEQRGVMVLITLFVIVAVGLHLSAVCVRPLKKIVRAIDSSSRDAVGGDILVNDCAETQQISEAYNRMLDRLRTLDESRQQFVSNVSHELKTPITSIRVLADSLLAQEDVPAELYREFMADISSEIDRESQIIDDLLTLVRMDKSAAELNIAEVNINEMLEAILKRLRPLALQRNVELLLESFRPVMADADEVKLNLAITNLVENAIKYNVDNGWVRVSINADHQFFYIKVEDSGIGIPQQDWDQIFERFYRVDKARSRATGGTGLGLAITKNIIVLHHGAIRVNSVEGEGTTFTVRIPRTYRRQEGGMV